MNIAEKQQEDKLVKIQKYLEGYLRKNVDSYHRSKMLLTDLELIDVHYSLMAHEADSANI